MWKSAIAAIQNSDTNWIKSNQIVFREFFKAQNSLEKGKFKDTALKEHHDSRLFKMFIEDSLGGLELDLRTGAKWIENASFLDGNWGWLLAIGVGGGYFTHYLDESIRRKYFKPINALVAGSGKPSGEAVKYEGLWIVNGSWDYCSGSEQASHFTAVTQKEGHVIAVLLPKDQIKIERNWNAIGLELTCSHRIIAEDARITSDHFFDLAKKPEYSDYPLSSYPFDLFARVCFVPVIIGISRALWLEIQKIADQKMRIWKQFQPKKYHKIQHLISAFEKELEKLSQDFYSAVAQSWQGHLRNKDVHTQMVQNLSLKVSRLCYENSSEIIPLLGMEVVESSHPLQLCWRNLQTAYQHMVFRDFN